MKKILIVILVLFVQQAFAEDIPQHYNPDQPYIGVGIGFGSGRSYETQHLNVAFAFMPTWQYQNHLYQIRYSGMFEFYMDGPNPSQNVRDICVLYGWCQKTDFYYAAISIGPGYIKGIKRGEFLGEPGVESYAYEELPFETVGLSIQVESFLLTPVVGLGVQLLGNVNPKQSYIAFALSLQVGYLLSFGKGQ